MRHFLRKANAFRKSAKIRPCAYPCLKTQGFLKVIAIKVFLAEGLWLLSP
jgi:hypothetical protein